MFFTKMTLKIRYTDPISGGLSPFNNVSQITDADWRGEGTVVRMLGIKHQHRASCSMLHNHESQHGIRSRS